MIIVRFTFFFILLFLAACQSAPPKKVSTETPAAEWSSDGAVFSDKQAGVARLAQWRLQGKVAVSGGSIRESANMIWNAREGKGSLRLYGPLGAGAVVINYDDDGANLTGGNTDEIKGDSVESVLQQALGWYVPLEALIYWVQGLPSPDFGFRYKLGAKQELNELAQLGWRLSFSKYVLNVNGSVRPRKITAQRMMLINGVEEQITVRIFVKSLGFEAGVDSGITLGAGTKSQK